MQTKGETGLIADIATGDSVRVSVKGRPFEEGDTVLFAIRPDMESEKLFEIAVTEFDDEGGAIFQFHPEDTAALGVGEFVYGINLIPVETGEPMVLIREAPFQVRGAVASDW